MEELIERIARWNIHPEELITHRFTLDKAPEAYSLTEVPFCAAGDFLCKLLFGKLLASFSCLHFSGYINVAAHDFIRQGEI